MTRYLNTFIFAVLMAALLSVPALPAQATERLITVTGHGMVAVAPDTAMIRIGVTTQGKTAREASTANAKQMTKVIGTIEQSGIAKKDIQTSQLSLQPQYDSKNGANRLLGFQVTNRVTIRVRKIADLPTVLDKAIAAGANEMSGIEFQVSGENKLLDQARADAIVDAHRKAELYAKAAGTKVGKAAAIIEQGSSTPPREFKAMRTTGGAVPVAPGEQILQASVTVSYELGR
ncbi:MAG: SIMPL domain-containing protein [Pseudolabrys sp.]